MQSIQYFSIGNIKQLKFFLRDEQKNNAEALNMQEILFNAWRAQENLRFVKCALPEKMAEHER